MRSRLIKALNNRFYVKFMQLEIGLFKWSFGLFVGVYLKENKKHAINQPACQVFIEGY